MVTEKMRLVAFNHLPAHTTSLVAFAAAFAGLLGGTTARLNA